MKKRWIYFMLIFCVVISGCARQPEISVEDSVIVEDEGIPGDETETGMEEELEVSLEEYVNNLHILESPIREYGEETGYIQLEDDLVVRILYPEGEITALNEVIEAWVNETVAEYQNESIGAREFGDSAELTAEYDSYIVNEEVVSVKITGFYDKPYLAHPIDIIATFHANLKTGELLTLEDVLLPDGENLLREK